MLVGSMEGVVAGAAGGGLLGSLMGWVFPRNTSKYEEQLKAGKYLLIAHGSADGWSGLHGPHWRLYLWSGCRAGL
jgi:hypothetical protein